MRHVISGGLIAATLGAALLVAGAAPASAQMNNREKGGGHISSGGGRVSGGAAIQGHSSTGRISSPRGSVRMSNAGPNHGQWSGNGDWRRHRRGDRGGVSIGLGFGAPYYAYGGYYDEPYYYGGGYAYGAAPAEDEAVAYCMSRFQSYDPDSGTYLGFDGLRHPCP